MGDVATRRVPPMPMEDPCPEPVRRRGGVRHDVEGKLRRNPSVDEALAGLSRHLEEPSAAKVAAARIRTGRSGNAGTAMLSNPA